MVKNGNIPAANLSIRKICLLLKEAFKKPFLSTDPRSNNWQYCTVGNPSSNFIHRGIRKNDKF